MNVLENNSITFDWSILFTGYSKGFINEEEVLKLIYSQKLTPITDDQIVQLEISKESRQEFLSTLKDVTLNYCKIHGIDLVNQSERNERVWQFGYLKEIASSNKSISEKLTEIESLWARFDYPKEWDDFIYYMPNEKLVNKSKEAVYDLFLSFLDESENELTKR